MVITVADADIESHPAIKLLQVCLHIGTILKDEINYVQITMSCRSVIPIRKPQQGHCGNEMNPAAFRFAVEMSGQQCMKFSSNRQNFSVCSIDSGLLRKQVGEMLPQSGVIIILTRRELGDLKRFVLTHNTRLRSRTTQGRTRHHKLVYPLLDRQQVFFLASLYFHTDCYQFSYIRQKRNLQGFVHIDKLSTLFFLETETSNA